MAKERTDEERAQRKKEKKEKRASENGIVKSSKKDKKSKRESVGGATDAETDGDTTLPVDEDAMDVDEDEVLAVDVNGDRVVKSGKLLGQLVPIAVPLADDKLEKKVLKGVKRATKHKALKRGVKEVVKSLRKSPDASQSNDGKKTGVVVIAADISPLDVISHLPVLCEEHAVPYIWVPSRQALGEAGNTKRPTSVVMMGPTRGKMLKRDEKGKVIGEEKGDKEEQGKKEEEWAEQYEEVWKAVYKAGRAVRK